MTADETQQEEEANDFTHLANTALGPVLLNFGADNPVTKKTAPKALFAGVRGTFNLKALLAGMRKIRGKQTTAEEQRKKTTNQALPGA